MQSGKGLAHNSPEPITTSNRNYVRFQTLSHMRAVSRGAPSLSPEARKKIGETLRASLGETLKRPLPLRHRDLLQEFENATAKENQYQGLTGGVDCSLDKRRR